MVTGWPARPSRPVVQVQLRMARNSPGHASASSLQPLQQAFVDLRPLRSPAAHRDGVLESALGVRQQLEVCQRSGRLVRGPDNARGWHDVSLRKVSMRERISPQNQRVVDVFVAPNSGWSRRLPGCTGVGLTVCVVQLCSHWPAAVGVALFRPATLGHRLLLAPHPRGNVVQAGL